MAIYTNTAGTLAAEESGQAAEESGSSSDAQHCSAEALAGHINLDHDHTDPHPSEATEWTQHPMTFRSIGTVLDLDSNSVERRTGYFIETQALSSTAVGVTEKGCKLLCYHDQKHGCTTYNYHASTQICRYFNMYSELWTGPRLFVHTDTDWVGVDYKERIDAFEVPFVRVGPGQKFDVTTDPSHYQGQESSLPSRFSKIESQCTALLRH